MVPTTTATATSATSCVTPTKTSLQLTPTKRRPATTPPRKNRGFAREQSQQSQSRSGRTSLSPPRNCFLRTPSSKSLFGRQSSFDRQSSNSNHYHSLYHSSSSNNNNNTLHDSSSNNIANDNNNAIIETTTTPTKSNANITPTKSTKSKNSTPSNKSNANITPSKSNTTTTTWTSDRFIPNRSHLRVDICRASVESAEKNLSATFDTLSRLQHHRRRENRNPNNGMDGGNVGGVGGSSGSSGSSGGGDGGTASTVGDTQQAQQQQHQQHQQMTPQNQYNSVVESMTPLQAEFRRRMRGALLNIPLEDVHHGGSGGGGIGIGIGSRSTSGGGGGGFFSAPHTYQSDNSHGGNSTHHHHDNNGIMGENSSATSTMSTMTSMAGSNRETISNIVYASLPDYSEDDNYGMENSMSASGGGGHNSFSGGGSAGGGGAGGGGGGGMSQSSSSRCGFQRMLSFQGSATTTAVKREESMSSFHSASPSSSLMGGTIHGNDTTSSLSTPSCTPIKMRRQRSGASSSLPSSSMSTFSSTNNNSNNTNNNTNTNMHSSSSSSIFTPPQPQPIDPFSHDQLHVLHRAASSNNNNNPHSYSNHASLNRIDSLSMAENRLRSVAKTIGRRIPKTPSRILDAPELVDDYYLNLVSWGANNVLAVALGQCVYLWEAETGSIRHLLTLRNEDDFVTSVSWANGMVPGNKNYIAIGTNHNAVQLWDAEAEKRLRSLDGHSARVGALSWNQHWLSSGGRDSQIIQHDVRSRNHAVSTYIGHTQEVCGLKWNDEGSTLASGGNENLLCLWDAAMSRRPNNSSDHSNHIGPRLQLTQHKAAVKALAWCPFHRGLLASGGGTADRTIKFWNTNSGAVLNSIDTGSQVCSLLWSKHQREICSSHGFSENQLILWKYPSMTKIQEFKGHTARVLHMDQSPDGGCVVSAAADETLNFWDVFGSPPNERKGNNLAMGNFCGSPMIR